MTRERSSRTFQLRKVPINPNWFQICQCCCRLCYPGDLLCLPFQFVQYDLQHDFAWTADEADRLVVLALLQVAFPGKCDD